MEARSFIVALLGPDIARPYKVFGTLLAAQARAQKSIDNGLCDRASLYSSQASDPSAAVDAVKRGEVTLIQSFGAPPTEQAAEDAFERFIGTEAGLNYLVRDMLKGQD
jgi:hypothetical protein